MTTNQTSPLSPGQLRLEITKQVRTVADCRNSPSEDHQLGILRGLLWALTGVDYGDVSNEIAVCRIAGIPCRDESGTYAGPHEVEWNEEEETNA